MMIRERYEVRLTDQAPRLGSGQRVVNAQVGRKWVYATKLVGEKNRVRIRRSVWETLSPRKIGECHG